MQWTKKYTDIQPVHLSLLNRSRRFGFLNNTRGNDKRIDRSFASDHIISYKMQKKRGYKTRGARLGHKTEHFPLSNCRRFWKIQFFAKIKRRGILIFWKTRKMAFFYKFFSNKTPSEFPKIFRKIGCFCKKKTCGPQKRGASSENYAWHFVHNF